MRNIDTDTVITILSIVFIGIIVLLAIIWGLNRGNIDRWWTGINKDTTTAKDEVYHTGSVRVYKFVNDNSTCFVADKQGESVGIFCK